MAISLKRLDVLIPLFPFLFGKGLRMEIPNREIESLINQAPDAQPGGVKEYWPHRRRSTGFQDHILAGSSSAAMIEPGLGDTHTLVSTAASHFCEGCARDPETHGEGEVRPSASP